MLFYSKISSGLLHVCQICPVADFKKFSFRFLLDSVREHSTRKAISRKSKLILSRLSQRDMYSDDVFYVPGSLETFSRCSGEVRCLIERAYSACDEVNGGNR